MPTNSRALAAISEIAMYPLLSRIGEPLTAQDECCVPIGTIPSWEAFSHVRSNERYSLKMDATLVNDFWDQVISARRAGLHAWASKNYHPWIDSMKSIVRPIAYLAVQRFELDDETRYQSRACLESGLSWGIVVEQFRGIANDTKMIETIVQLTRCGRLVTGWRGDYPKGELLVF